MSAIANDTPAAQARALGLVWCDPPKRHRATKLQYGQWARVLRSRPNEWALVFKWDNVSSGFRVAREIRTGKVPDLPPGKYEAQGGRPDAKTSGLWLRYIPQPQPQ